MRKITFLKCEKNSFTHSWIFSQNILYENRWSEVKLCSNLCTRTAPEVKSFFFCFEKWKWGKLPLIRIFNRIINFEINFGKSLDLRFQILNIFRTVAVAARPSRKILRRRANFEKLGVKLQKFTTEMF